LDNIFKGKYNAIITWAPDRLSRNAGDLGRIVDLIKLELINCHSQTFSNSRGSTRVYKELEDYGGTYTSET
jgi:DNA invertase Pin-like site-specific DNA recombinase